MDKNKKKRKGGLVLITVKEKGDFSKTTKILSRKISALKPNMLSKYGEAGVKALSDATPVNSGTTSNSWYYEISEQNGLSTITFCNSNINKGVPIAIILQYGHATRNGGYVQGIDYIDPAVKPIFEELADNAWKEVTK